MKPFDAVGAFHPSARGGELRRLAIRGAGATVFFQGLALAVQVLSTVVLARLLVPRDFGLLAMVTTFSMLLSNFGINGFTEAVLQRGEIDRFLASNLFWINAGAGALLTLGFAAAGPLLAWFFRDPLVARVTAGVSLTILLGSTSVLHLALLKRAMRFSAVAVNDIAARSISVAVSILLAWVGWGYWALVAGAVALPLTTSVGAWSLCRWVPSLPRRVPGTAAMVRFALHVYGRFSVYYAARNTDNVLVGWRFSAQALGFYNKAYNLFALATYQLVSPLSNVAVAALSRLHHDSAEYRRYVLNAVAVIALVGMGLGGDLALVGRDVIRLFLGPGWEQAGNIFRFFGPGVGIMLLYGMHGWIHLSIGRPDRWLRWALFEFGFTTALFLLVLRWGPAGIALAWTASCWILIIPAFWYAGRPIRFGVSPLLKAAWKYVLASLLAAWATAVIVGKWDAALFEASGVQVALRGIIAISALFAALYVSGVTVLHGGFAPVRQVAWLVREMVPWGKFPNRGAAAVLARGLGRRAGPESPQVSRV